VPPGIKCPHCGTTLHEVVSTRRTAGGVARTRRCLNEHNFQTTEAVRPSVRKGCNPYDLLVKSPP
jgi:transcriptional regulator NrdR family protein